MEKTHWRTQFGERLRKAAEEMFGGVDGLAKIWDVKNKSGIYGYMNGNRIPGGELLERLINKVNIEWLLTGEGSMNIPLPIAKAEKTFKVPVFGSVLCGSPAPLWDKDEIKEYIDLPDLMKFKYSFGLIAKGDSMAPYINPGDYLICVDKPELIKDGKAVVTVFKGTVDNNEVNAKLITRDVNKGIVTLYSVNTKYPPLNYSENEILKIYKLIKIIRDVK